jgi:hypothetical protein
MMSGEPLLEAVTDTAAGDIRPAMVATHQGEAFTSDRARGSSTAGLASTRSHHDEIRGQNGLLEWAFGS